MGDFYASRVMKARKVYQCDGCRKAVEIGETYRRDVGVYEGDFYSYPSHIECYELNLEMFGDSGVHSTEWSGMWDEFDNGDYRPDDPFRVRFDAIRATKRAMKDARATP